MRNNNILNKLECISKTVDIPIKLIVSFSGIYIYFFSDEEKFLLIKGIVYFITMSYYIIDTCVIICNKNYLFIPHHICAIGMLKLIYNFKYNTIKPIMLGMGLIDFSGITVSYRGVLKKQNNLTLLNDSIMLFIYISIRQIYYLYHLYYDYTVDTIEENIVLNISILLYIMSFYWSIMWTKSIIKYNKLLKVN